MKVTLINPRWENRGISSNNVSLFSFPPQGLVQLASLTPLDWQVEIVDENTADIDFDEPTDLVGLTGMTSLAPRAYEIAAKFREKKIPTIMGGIHASMIPGEAKRHVDSVVTGEADLIWPGILRDFENGNLRQIYRADLPSNLDFPVCRAVNRTYPISFSRFLPDVKFAYFQTSRGCSLNCKHCSTTRFNGRIIRTKSMPDLLEEIRQERIISNFDFILFVNDNIMADPRYARELFRELRQLEIRWFSQTDIRIANNDIIDLACQSGLSGVFLGLEAVNPSFLQQTSQTKERWRSCYEPAVKRLRERGVIVYASFMIGFDNESDKTVDEVVDWAIENKIDIAEFMMLTPLPGTELFEEMSKAGRIRTRDWNLYGLGDCVFEPIGWSKEGLEEALKRAYKEFYSLSSITRRINRRLPFRHFVSTLMTNFDFRRFGK